MKKKRHKKKPRIKMHFKINLWFLVYEISIEWS
nr:MAG TPA: hypothetical protein [Caudoviricetes sp.]